MHRHLLPFSASRLCITVRPRLRQRLPAQGTLLRKRQPSIYSICLVTGWLSPFCSFQISEKSTRQACGETGRPLTPSRKNGSGPEKGRKPNREGIFLWLDALESHSLAFNSLRTPYYIIAWNLPARTVLTLFTSKPNFFARRPCSER